MGEECVSAINTDCEKVTKDIRLDRFSRIVVGYHGASAASVAFVNSLISGDNPISAWKFSENEYDWLGRGIYFWEHGPERAKQWAGESGTVIGAIIHLGRCFDLTDVGCTSLLHHGYEKVRDRFAEKNMVLPRNTGREMKLRNLDCLVLNDLMTALDNNVEGDNVNFQTVRCPFFEGVEAFPDSGFNTQTHLQIAVRDVSCILGVFRPNLED